jgi:hypothetical protein
MSSLGIYFGSKIISIVDTNGKKVAANAHLLQSTVTTGELGEKVPVELKAIELVALFKDELRRNKITAKEAAVCLSGKDLIIRNFEIPILPREELQGAISFEAKKYIPFRIEDLVSDFQLEQDKVNKRNQVLFMGIKKETLDRYLSLANDLNLKINAIEYSAFSLIRALALSGISTKGIIAIVCADLKEEDEANFIVLENGFPVFSRDISLASGPDDLGKSAESDAGMGLEKLKTEIRVSLDYYHRKFPARNIQRIFLISNPEHRSELEAGVMETGLTAQFLEISKYTGSSVAYSSSFAKGYTVSLAKAIRSDIKLNLLASRARLKAGVKPKAAPLDLSSLVKGIKINPLVILLGIAICVGVFIFGQSQTKPLQEELSGVINKQVKISSIKPEATFDELIVIDSGYKTKLDSLDKLIKRQLYLTYPLDVIPRVIPEGVWLVNFTFKKDNKGVSDLLLKGVAVLGDSDKEMEAVSNFASNLKENSSFNQYFKNIKTLAIDRVEAEGGSAMTNFSISCKTN